MVLGEKEYVFGLVDEEVREVSLRSHGSLHEVEVPLIASIPKSEIDGEPRENKDLATIITRWLLGR